MARKSAMKEMSVSATGRPTEKTGAPQARDQHGRHAVMDGIVHGVPRHTYTPMLDGLVRSACSHKATSGVHKVPASATKLGLQEMGSVPYADAKLGR